MEEEGAKIYFLLQTITFFDLFLENFQDEADEWHIFGCSSLAGARQERFSFLRDARVVPADLVSSRSSHELLQI